MILLETYRIIREEHRTPFILDKGENVNDADDHTADYEDDDHQTTVHLAL